MHMCFNDEYISDRPIIDFFITDTNYLHVYVPDNRYAEPIFIYLLSPFFTLVFPHFSRLNINNKQVKIISL